MVDLAEIIVHCIGAIGELLSRQLHVYLIGNRRFVMQRQYCASELLVLNLTSQRGQATRRIAL